MLFVMLEKEGLFVQLEFPIPKNTYDPKNPKNPRYPKNPNIQKIPINPENPVPLVSNYGVYNADMNQESESFEKTSKITTEDSEEEATNEQTLMMKVPYAGKKGEGLIRGLKTCLQNNLPDNIKCRIVQTGTKISKNFNEKDKVDKSHLSNFIYRHKCKNKKCNDPYIGETDLEN